MHNNLLKPMSVGTIIDQTFRLYRNNFLSVILFSLLIGGSITAAISMFSRDAQLFGYFSSVFDMMKEITTGEGLNNFTENYTAPSLSKYLLSMLLSLLNMILVMPFVSGGIVFITLAYAHGIKETAGVWFSQVRPLYGKLIATMLAMIFASSIIVSLLFTAFMIIVALVIAFGVQNTWLFLILIPFALAFLLGLIALLAFIALVYPAAVQENLYGFKSIGRAWNLFRRKFWKTIGLVVLVYLITSIVTVVLSMAIAFLPWVAMYIADAAIGALISPVALIAITLLYLDIRMTKEGYDLQLRAESVEYDTN